jgi:hypothetical protein
MDYGSSQMNVYSCAPETGEWGPEVIYQLEFPVAGAMTAAVECGPGIDIDLHLLTSLDENACIDRAHEVLGPINVEAGTYFLSADSWSTDTGFSYPGPYELEINFVPGEVIPEEPPSSSCDGWCDDAAPAGCGCGPDCVGAGDCCLDACDLCGACEETVVEPEEEEPQEEEPQEEEPQEEEPQEEEPQDQNVGESAEDEKPWVIDSAGESPGGPPGLGNNLVSPTPGMTALAPAVESEEEGCKTNQGSLPVGILVLCSGLFLLGRLGRREEA